MCVKDLPRISFGLIVLNGEPFISYNLRSIYPFAYEIIVVEGAVPAAANIATPDGHSTDGTLETLRRFQANEDPENKVTVVTAEDEGYPDGFWPGEKDEQSQAYACRASGNYLWQVDVDEFYKPEDMQYVLNMLRQNPEITAVSFKMITFWAGFDYLTDGWYLRQGAEIYHRLFKWGEGYRYITHRPPTVYDAQGRDTRQVNWIDGHTLAQQGILLYHYSLLFPKQVIEKCEYYGTAAWARRSQAQQWAQEVFMKLSKPHRVHNVYAYPSWLDRFEGDHPPQIVSLQADLEAGRLQVDMRTTDDIEQLLSSFKYALTRAGLKLLFPYWLLWQRNKWRIEKLIRYLTKRNG